MMKLTARIVVHLDSEQGNDFDVDEPIPFFEVGSVNELAIVLENVGTEVILCGHEELDEEFLRERNNLLQSLRDILADWEDDAREEAFTVGERNPGLK